MSSNDSKIAALQLMADMKVREDAAQGIPSDWYDVLINVLYLNAQMEYNLTSAEMDGVCNSIQKEHNLPTLILT